jgi:hypothetical protein
MTRRRLSLKETFFLMNRQDAPGVDRVSMLEYG